MLGFDKIAIKPNLINKYIGLRLNAYLIDLFLKFLSIVKVFIINYEKLW